MLMLTLTVPATAATSADGRLTFTVTPSASTVTAGSSVTYTYRIVNNTSDTFYRSSATDSHCSPISAPWVIGPRETVTYTCTRTNLQATTTSTANISYYTYDEFWDPLAWWRDYSQVSVATTVTVTPNPAATPRFTCETPTVFIGANDTRTTAATPTVLYNQYQGATASEFIAIGSDSTPVKVQYNAMAYNPDDGYIYAISSRPPGSQRDSSWLMYGRLLRIDANGQATDLRDISGFVGSRSGVCDDTDCNTDAEGGLTSGAIADGVYYVSNASSSGTRYLYSVNLAQVLATAVTPAATLVSTNTGFVTNDFAPLGGYLWGIENGSAGPTMLRYDVSAGTVEGFSLSGLGLPGGRTYGAAWVYGNGNLGFSDNAGSGVYQISVADPDSPTFELVTHISGPGSLNNDGTSCVSTNNVDLSIDKTGPTTPRYGETITWNLTITNNGPGISSGGVLTDTVPDGFTNVSVATEYADVCTVVDRAVTCRTGVLNPGDSYAIPVTATAPSDDTCRTNTATITGNEADATPGNNSSSQTLCATSALIDLRKTAGAAVRNADGSYTASYTVEVANTGTAPGSYTQITDVPRFGAENTITGVAWSGGPGATGQTPVTRNADGSYNVGPPGPSSIAVGTTHTYTVLITFTVNPDAPVTACNGGPDAGLFNQVSLPEETGPTSNNADCATRPGLAVEKTGSATHIDSPQAVTYTYTVTNSGDEPLDTVGLVDDSCTGATLGSGDTNNDGILQISETWIYTCTTTVSATTTNTVTVTGRGTVSGNNVRATDSFSVTLLTPVLNLTKTAGSVTGPATDGTYTVGYQVSVANAGTAAGSYGPIDDTVSFDPTLTPVSAAWTGPSATSGQTQLTGAPYDFDIGGSATSIDPDEVHRYAVTITYRIDGTGTPAACDGPGTGLYNAVSLPSGPESGSLDDADCVAAPVPEPVIDVTKVGSATVLDAPGAVTYTYTVTNPGTEPLREVTLADDRCGAVSGPSGDGADGVGAVDSILEATETWTYTCTSTLSGTTTNIVTVTGVGVASGRTVADTSTWTVTVTLRAIGLHKLTTSCAPAASPCPIGGAQFALYHVDPRTAGAPPITDGVTVDPAVADGSEFVTTPLAFATDYWLVETASPPGHQLLAQPIQFTLTASGITLSGPNGGTAVVSTADAFALDITNTPDAVLPETGGAGVSPSLPWGLAWFGAGLTWFVLTRHARRTQAVAVPVPSRKDPRT